MNSLLKIDHSSYFKAKKPPGCTMYSITDYIKVGLAKNNPTFLTVSLEKICE